jgi:hypothetical protein
MSKNESSYRVDLHILDHAETIYNSIDEYNPLKHKAHFMQKSETLEHSFQKYLNSVYTFI